MDTRMRNVILGAMLAIMLIAGVGHADLSDGLVGYWSFDNPANLGYDYSGTGNHGSAVGGATPTSGVMGGAVHLNGSAYINVPDSPSLDLPGGRGTVAAFIRVDTSSDEFGVVSKESSSSFLSTIAYEYRGFSYGTLESFGISDGETGNWVNNSGPSLKDSLWHHVAVTWSGPGGELVLYRDGVRVDQTAQTISTINNISEPVRIGAFRWNVGGMLRCLTGDMDEVRIYNRALSETEIQQLAGTAEPDIEVSPLVYDFGDVEIGDSATTCISVSNTGDGDLIVDSIGFQSGSSPDFSAATPLLPQTISPDGSIDIQVTFAPSEALPSLAFLEIHSNDPDESLTYVSLVGTGVEKPPSEQIQEILELVYDAVTDGALVGVGAPTVAKNKLQDWIAKLQYARNLAEAGSLADAYVWLEDAYKLADGDIRPPDHVRGSAVPQVAEDLKALLDELTPELEFEFASSTGNALVYSIPISVADRRMGKALAEEALSVTENALKFLISPKNKANPWFFVADVLVLVSELYDPVTVVPVGPNMDVTGDNEILSTVSPATGNDDYSAIVVLDLLGTGWTEEDAARVNSGLTLRAENRYGTEFYGSVALLTKDEIKSLNPNRCYVIAPKSYFQATWAAPTYVFLNAFYQYGLGEDGDIEPILIRPE